MRTAWIRRTSTKRSSSVSAKGAATQPAISYATFPHPLTTRIDQPAQKMPNHRGQRGVSPWATSCRNPWAPSFRNARAASSELALPHVLGVEASRESGGADQVAEHYRELATLSRGCGLTGLSGGGGGRWLSGCANTIRFQRRTAVGAEPRASTIGGTARRTARRESRAAYVAELADIGRFCFAARTFHRHRSV